jgi:hypothetical protein
MAFTPLVPEEVCGFENIPWPEELQMTPIRRNTGLWGFDRAVSSGLWGRWFNQASWKNVSVN